MICALCAPSFTNVPSRNVMKVTVLLQPSQSALLALPLLILFIVSFITGMTRFFQRRINYTQHCVL